MGAALQPSAHSAGGIPWSTIRLPRRPNLSNHRCLIQGQRLTRNAPRGRRCRSLRISLIPRGRRYRSLPTSLIRACRLRRAKVSRGDSADSASPLGSIHPERSCGYAGSTTFKCARLSARSCSAVKACPQVLHLQVVFGLNRLLTPRPGPFSLGRNAITSSPPHSRHSRLATLYCYHKPG